MKVSQEAGCDPDRSRLWREVLLSGRLPSPPCRAAPIPRPRPPGLPLSRAPPSRLPPSPALPLGTEVASGKDSSTLCVDAGRNTTVCSLKRYVMEAVPLERVHPAAQDGAQPRFCGQVRG